VPAVPGGRRLALLAAVGIAIALATALLAQWSATLDALARFRVRLLPLILLAVLANYALRFAKWQLYLTLLAIPLPPGRSLWVFLAGLTMALTPAKLGEVLKAVLVRDLVGTEVARTASVVVAERLTDVGGPLVLGLVAILLGLAVASLRSRRVARLAARTLDRAPGLARLRDPLRSFVGSGRALLTPPMLLAALALSVASWFFECLALHVVLVGLGAPTSLRTATFVYAFASLAGAVSMLPGGLGVAEGSLATLLSMLGTRPPDAAAATLVIRAATLWFGVGVGVVTVALASPPRGPAPAPATRALPSSTCGPRPGSTRS
jgi:uncharacterized membrane protein YbhN (UPF0104 family)